MDIKTIGVVILVIAALVIGYAVISSKAIGPSFLKEKTVAASVFVQTLTDAKKVYIIQDLRNANPKERTSVQQCGVDFAASKGLVQKEKVIFAFEDSGCTALEGKRDLGSCMDELAGQEVLYIEKGNQTLVYEKALLIGLGENYTKGSCNVNIPSPQPTAVSTIANDLLNTSNSS